MNDPIRKVLTGAALALAPACSDLGGGKIDVTVYSQGHPLPEADVVIDRADGSLFDTVRTDSAGQASYRVPDGGYLTVPRLEEGFTTSFGGLGGGNRLRVGGSARQSLGEVVVTLAEYPVRAAGLLLRPGRSERPAGPRRRVADGPGDVHARSALGRVAPRGHEPDAAPRGNYSTFWDGEPAEMVYPPGFAESFEYSVSVWSEDGVSSLTQGVESLPPQASIDLATELLAPPSAVAVDSMPELPVQHAGLLPAPHGDSRIYATAAYRSTSRRASTTTSTRCPRPDSVDPWCTRGGPRTATCRSSPDLGSHPSAKRAPTPPHASCGAPAGSGSPRRRSSRSRGGAGSPERGGQRR